MRSISPRFQHSKPSRKATSNSGEAACGTLVSLVAAHAPAVRSDTRLLPQPHGFEGGLPIAIADLIGGEPVAEGDDVRVLGGHLDATSLALAVEGDQHEDPVP